MKQRRRIDYPAAQGEDYADWRAWALAEAATLDPLLDGPDAR